MSSKVTLINADFRDVIGDLSYDTIVTDPPYKLTSGGKNTGKMGGIFSPKSYNNGGSIVDADISWEDMFIPLFNSMSERGHAYFMTNHRNMYKAYECALQAGFRYHNTLVWDKGTVIPNRWYMSQTEFILFFRKGKAFPIKNKGSKQVVDHKPVRGTKMNPTQKPVDLMKELIYNSTNSNSVVIDPFMGSGTTGVPVNH